MSAAILRPDRRVLRMYGRDPLRMIQGLATNDIAGAGEGVSVYTAFLTPKGKMIADARVVRLAGGDILIEADAAAADNIAANLKKFVPPLFGKFDFTNLRVVRADAERFAHVAVLANPYQPGVTDLIVEENDAQGIASADLEAERIEAGEPKWGAELTEAVIPLEAGLRNVAISETKGCYTGQEVIVRILHRGHVNRHLRGVLLGDAAVPEAGAAIDVNGKQVGTITSAVRSERFGETIALAYVRREVELPASAHVDGHEASIIELPFINAFNGATQ